MNDHAYETTEKTPPQVLMTVGVEGELSKPVGQTTSAYRKFREMRRDPTIALARALSVSPILMSHWSIESNPGASEDAKAFISRIMLPMRMHVLRTAMFGCVDFGWQPYEKVFKVNEQAEVVLVKLKPLLQDVTDILVCKDTGDFRGVRQCSALNPNADETVELSTEESIVLSIDVEGTNWYGDALMRVAEKPYDQAVEVEKSAGRYDRKIAGAHWVVYYPAGTSKVDGADLDNSEVARRILSRLESSGSIAVPRSVSEVMDTMTANAALSEATQWKIELISAQGGSTPFIDRFKYIDALKARAFGLPERAVLEGQFGTKAEAEAHADFAVTNMELRHRFIVQQLNEGVVNQLLRLNYGRELVDTIYIEPAPIADLALMFLRALYTKILESPEGFMLEVNKIDMEALKDKLEVPVRPESDVSATDSDVAAINDIIKRVIGAGVPQDQITAPPAPPAPGF